MPFNALHLSVPSFPIPVAYGATGEFRADIAFTLFLHVVLLVECAFFCATVLGNGRGALIAFALFIITPTLAFYTPLLDSRYLGLLTWIPGMMLLLRSAPAVRANRGVAAAAALAGFLLSVGQDIHYTTAYLGVPFTIAYWCLLGVTARANRAWLVGLIAFAAGAVVYWLIVELAHHVIQGSVTDPIRILFQQREHHISAYGQTADMLTTLAQFVSEMGIPMMALVVAGFIFVIARRARFVANFNLTVITATAALGTAILLFVPTMPFYRQFSGLQLTFALLAAVVLDRMASRSRALTIGAFVLFCVAAYLPAVRAAEVYQAHQGLGRTLRAATAFQPNPQRIWFETEKYPSPGAPVGKALLDFGIGGSRIRTLPAGDVIVTELPQLGADPYMLAVLSATQPLGRFPTEWCTNEEFAENGIFFKFERFQDEPERCEARAYSVRSLLATMGSRAIAPVNVSADSEFQPRYSSDHIFNAVEPEWGSGASSTVKHFVEVDFATPESLAAFAMAPPVDAPGPIDELTVTASPALRGTLEPLWHASGLGHKTVFTATFQRTAIQRIRFTIDAEDGRAMPYYAGIRQVIFPGLRIGTARHYLPPRLTFGNGFWGLEQSGHKSWEWSAAKSVMTIGNEATRARTFDVVFSLQRPNPQGLYVDVRVRNATKRYALAGSPTVHMTVAVGAAQHVDVSFSTNAEKLASRGDFRDLRFQVVDPAVTVP